MALIQKEWIAADAVTGDTFRLDNDQYLKGRNAADSANVNIVKINTSDRIEFASVPQVTADPSANNDLARKSWIDTQLALYQLLTGKNAANGYAGLDGSAKIPSSLLPSYVDDVEEYANQAAFPVTGETGKIYVSLATNETFRWSGSVYVEISTGDVASVNTKTGVVTLVTDDIAEDGSPVNLWFTDARAKAAAVADSITNGVTDVAPSQNAVYDALALKADSSHTHVAADITDFTSAARTAAVLNSTAGSQTDQAASVSAMKSYVATEISAITGADAEFEVKTLSAGDITNQYIDLGFEALDDSVHVFPKGGPEQLPTDDYTLSYTGGTGGVTRVTFVNGGDLNLKMVAGKKLVISYLKA